MDRNIWIIAIGVKGRDIKTYRLLEYNIKELDKSFIFNVLNVWDIDANQLKQEIKEGKINLSNAILEGEKLVGTKGKLKNYSHYDVETNKFIFQSYVILGYNNIGEYVTVLADRNEQGYVLLYLTKDSLHENNGKLANVARKETKNGKKQLVGIRFVLDMIERLDTGKSFVFNNVQNKVNEKKSWRMNILRKNNFYGNHCLYTKNRPLVVFSDLTYSDKFVGGQQVAKYYIDTLLAMNNRLNNLKQDKRNWFFNLYGSESEWSIDYFSFLKMLEVLREELRSEN